METATHPKIDMTQDKAVIFSTALLPEQSPYSLQSNPKIRVAHMGMEFVPVTDIIQEKVMVDGRAEYQPREIRYMASQKSIYVDEQVKNGVPVNYGKGHLPTDRKSRNDVIIIENGKIDVVPKQQRNLIEYLKMCNYNLSNPNRNPKIRGLFQFNDVVSKAEREYDATKSITKAKYLVSTLEGNYRRLQDIALLLHMDGNATEKQLLMALTQKCETNADLIITTISEDKAQVDLIVTKALDLGLIEFTGTAYRYAGQDENIKGFRGKQNSDVAFKIFVKWLGDDEGQGDLLNIEKLLNAKLEQLKKSS